MAAFAGYVTGVGIKYVPIKDADGEVSGSEPVVEVRLRAVKADVHSLADHLGDMVGKPITASITLDQERLGLEVSE